MVKTGGKTFNGKRKNEEVNEYEIWDADYL